MKNLFVMLLVALTFLTACKDDSTKEDAEKTTRKQTTVNCSDKPLSVEIDGVLLQVGRNYSIVKDGERQYQLGQGDYCSMRRINGVAQIGGGDFGVSVYDDNWESVRQSKLNLMQKLDVREIKVSDYTIKRYGDGIFYSLPLDQAPTGNGKPVIIQCSPRGDEYSDDYTGKELFRTCSTGYMHPSGLWIFYRFGNLSVWAKDFLTVDKQRREILEKMLISTPEQQVGEQ